MSSAEYNDKALEMALCNIEHIMEAVDEWHDEKKMTDEAHFAMRNELGMAWTLINYMRTSNNGTIPYNTMGDH